MNVLIVGSLAYDYIMNFSGLFTDRIMEDKIHSISLSFLVDTLKKQQGGTAGNIAYSSKLLGLEPFIVCPAGNDFAPYKKFFKQKKIKTTYIPEYDDVSMSSYFVVTDTKHNQIGSFYTGAIAKASKHSISSVKEHMDFAIIAPTDPKAMIEAVKDCQKQQLPYMYDPAFQIAVFSKEELELGISKAQIVIGNDYEIGLMEDKLEISHDEFVSRVPILITTLGDKGSIIETITDSIHIKPAKVKKTVDPTGAGDAYRAGFIAGFLKKFPLHVCGQLGSVAAAYTVEIYGTQTHHFSKIEFIRRYNSNFPERIKL